LSKKSDIRIQKGLTEKQYGRFQLKRFEVYRGVRQIPTGEYEIVLEIEGEDSESLGLIKANKSTLPELLSYLHDWQHQEYNQIYRTKRLQEQAANDEMKARYQYSLDFWESRYAHVDQAIRELEPDYQPDTTIKVVPQDPSEENKEECRFE
jgi:hypothetical protein